MMILVPAMPAATPKHQQGISLLVALVMILVMTLLGVSAMNTAVFQLKMAGNMQQQNIALNRAEETLAAAENATDAIVADSDAFNFGAADGYYLKSDAINVHSIDWTANGLTAVQLNPAIEDYYVTEYLGPKPIPGETIKVVVDGRITGGAVHTFRNTSLSESAKSALRLVQSIYVTEDAP